MLHSPLTAFFDIKKLVKSHLIISLSFEPFPIQIYTHVEVFTHLYYFRYEVHELI